jgi:predicted GTPase
MWTLVMGKGGVGKSSTVNSLIDERVAVVSAFQSETTKALQHARSRASFTLNIINTLGLVKGGGLNDQDIGIIRRFLLNKTIDVLLYVDQLDSYQVGNLDMQVIRAITQLFGGIAILVLTHAQLLLADHGVEYLDFVLKRSAGLQGVI